MTSRVHLLTADGFIACGGEEGDFLCCTGDRARVTCPGCLSGRERPAADDVVRLLRQVRRDRRV